MQLLSARFENFRLLRDLELDFANGEDGKLTVIRAANETGKTTILSALQWALYGDAALPDKGVEFRLHPIDWDTTTGTRVPITVTVNFEVTKYNKMGTGVHESRSRYQIVRAAFEDITGITWRRSPATVKLFALTENGARPLDAPESFINDELPPELREVFFTDGDRALSFIESDVSVSTKRERVQGAIRSLLGLKVIEDAIGHVRKASGEFNRQAKKLGGDSRLATIATQLESASDLEAKCTADLADAKAQFMAYDEKLRDVERKIDEALKKGDKEKLQKDLEATRKAIVGLEERIASARKEHSNLFRTEALARDILKPELEKAFEILSGLREKGKIPNTTIPVLEERLSTLLCICGESLREDDESGQRRRQHISQLIDGSRRADAVQGIVTDLYFGSKSLERRPGDEDGTWIALYTKVVADRDGLQRLRDDEGRKLKGLELQVDSLASTDIQGLREVQRKYKEMRDRFNSQRSIFETQIDGAAKERAELTQERDRLLREQKKGAQIMSELEVATDIVAVLERAFERVTGEELAKVSELMNSIFLEMIGADPEQGAIIKQASISREFDIVVLGPEGRTLSPGRDLNGASRRALTLAFILALTRVSEVEAPNVIDTPLGMMSGYVKHSVLRAAIRESSQLILFLTHSEIAGCEKILDDNASVVITLTNPAHYPKMLVHDPGIKDRKVLRCECNHRGSCTVCERRPDVEELLVSGAING